MIINIIIDKYDMHMVLEVTLMIFIDVKVRSHDHPIRELPTG